MIAGNAARIIELQDDTGCFPAEMISDGRSTFDRNGFVTALVLRALRYLTGDARLQQVRSSALNFLERCRSRRVLGAFGFWPEDSRPAWAARVPPDVDDTAIMTIELLRHGRLRSRDALRTVCHVLLKNRVVQLDEPAPPWILSGAFRTWIAPGGARNVVDCGVNANAAALLALLGATHLPGYRQAVETVIGGVDWAGGDPARIRSLTPFYPSVGGLLEAVEHAVECGADGLSAVLDPLRILAAECDDEELSACCSGAYSATVWRCNALRHARAMRQSLEAAGRLDQDSHARLGAALLA